MNWICWIWVSIRLKVNKYEEIRNVLDSTLEGDK